MSRTHLPSEEAHALQLRSSEVRRQKAHAQKIRTLLDRAKAAIWTAHDIAGDERLRADLADLQRTIEEMKLSVWSRERGS